MTKESQDKDYDRAMQIEGDGIDGDFEITDLPSAFYFLCCEDATAINEEMLRSATANAKRKAEVLCDAAGVKLGDLVSINYSWGELNIYSDTNYGLAKDCLADPMTVRAIDIEPDDIDIRDTATFVWEIE